MGLRAKVWHCWLLREKQWVREEEEEAELVWNSTTICRQQLQLPAQEPIPQQLPGLLPELSSPCLPWFLPQFPLGAAGPARVPISHRLGLSSRSCKSCKSLKRAADSLGVLLGMQILMEISPDPKSRGRVFSYSGLYYSAMIFNA